jgi:hypothetical protein
MKMWGQSKQHQNAVAGGDEFDAAAARVSAEVAEPGPGAAAVEPEPENSLEIRPEWAEAAARLCFVPAAKLVHPAYALEDGEAAAISPQMQAFLQAVADKYAPAALGRVASKYPEFFDLAAALGVLYWQKWRHVSRIQRLEAEERTAALAGKPSGESAAPVSIRAARAGEKRDAETGALII